MTGLAFVGAGIVAELYAKAVERGVSARFAGVYDVRQAAAVALAHRLGGRVFESLDGLLAAPDVDAVVVMSPTETHVEVASRCLKAGKHVLLEKPVAEMTAEIDRLRDLALQCGRICMPAHNYIYNPALQRMRRLISEGRLGKLASLWILYNIHHDEATAARYGGVLREVAIHHAYSLLYLAGRPDAVMASTSRLQYDSLEAEDQALVVCRMPEGGLANLWVSFAASDPTNDPWTVTYKALGTRGGAAFTWADAVVQDDGGPAWGLPNYVDSFWSELQFFIEKAINSGARPLSSLEDARDALLVIEAAERSLVAGGAFQPVAYP